MAVQPPKSSHPSQGAHRAEREAQERIQAARQRVKEAQDEVDTQVAYIREEGDRRAYAEKQRSEDQIQSTRAHGYEDLRKTRRAVEDELANLRRSGEKDVNQAEEYYRDEIYTTERDSQKELIDIKNHKAQEMDTEQKRGFFELESLKQQNTQQSADMRAMHEERVAELHQDTRTEYEKMKQTHTAANQDAHQTFEGRYKKTLDQQNAVLQRINSEAARRIEKIRAGTAMKLDAYRERQRDPFYQLVDIDASLHDAGDHYRVVASAPAHERDNIRISAHGKQITISGQRSSDETLKENDGEVRSTTSFQSYRQTIPIDWPIDSKGITREVDGDDVIFRIPKQGPYAKPDPYKKKVDPVKVERPKFPSNLPVAEMPKRDDDDESMISPASAGSETLEKPV